MDDSQPSPRVLIADDDKDLVEALEFWLDEYDNPEVITTTNGADAVEEIDSTVNVFLCDRRMPEMTGAEVIERMRREGYDIPTIVISAYEPDTRLQESDVELYLEKPIFRDKLFEALDCVLAG